MSRPIIAVDIDDVLAENAVAFVNFSNERWGTNLRVNDYEEHWAKVWQLEHDMSEVFRRRDEFIDSERYRTYSPIKSGYETLLVLSKKFDLRVVSSRLSVMRDGTLEWLNIHYPGIFQDETIHFAGIWDRLTDASVHTTKANALSSIGASYLIDDQLKHCFAAADMNIETVLFGDYGWNQVDTLPHNVTRCIDWSSVGEYFDTR